MHKHAKANLIPVRQRTQFSCMAASMSMALGANGIECDEDEVNKVMGCKPMQGATWEQAIACAQHWGMRATLVSPCTLGQLKAWTDRGVPVLIAWNPEGRDWSHASCVFDVDAEGNVHVADPNCPDPEQTVRVVPKAEFFSKWSEKWPNYLVRRPALAIEREITPDGRQVMASAKKVAEASDCYDDYKAGGLSWKEYQDCLKRFKDDGGGYGYSRTPQEQLAWDEYNSYKKALDDLKKERLVLYKDYLPIVDWFETLDTDPSHKESAAAFRLYVLLDSNKINSKEKVELNRTRYRDIKGIYSQPWGKKFLEHVQAVLKSDDVLSPPPAGLKKSDIARIQFTYDESIKKKWDNVLKFESRLSGEVEKVKKIVESKVADILSDPAFKGLTYIKPEIECEVKLNQRPISVNVRNLDGYDPSIPDSYVPVGFYVHVRWNTNIHPEKQIDFWIGWFPYFESSPAPRFLYLWHGNSLGFPGNLFDPTDTKGEPVFNFPGSKESYRGGSTPITESNYEKTREFTPALLNEMWVGIQGPEWIRKMAEIWTRWQIQHEEKSRPKVAPRPSPSTTSGGSDRKLEILDALLAKRPGDGFIKAIREQVARGKPLSEAQLKAVRANLYKNYMRPEADHFRQASDLERAWFR